MTNPRRRNALKLSAAHRSSHWVSLSSLISFGSRSAVFGAPFVAFYNLILHHFHIRGGLFIDAGLLGSLMCRISRSLPTPAWYGEESFYAVHISALMREILPFTMSQIFASFVGVSHDLLTMTSFVLLMSDNVHRNSLA